MLKKKRVHPATAEQTVDASAHRAISLFGIGGAI
jgi:hypothetical protein